MIFQSTSTRWRDYADYASGTNHTVVGNVKIFERLSSPELGNMRNILVYLPPSYGMNDRRYPVIYMHDGQNLFDAATSYAGEWRVDETMEALSAEGLEAIVVGVPNSGMERINEYSPFRDPYGRGGDGDRYLAFLVETVKPIIDRDFSTLPECQHTGLLGSSMGGLISLYAFFRHPEVFGLAGVISPSIWFAERAILPYVQSAPCPSGKLYVDIGTHEGPPARTDAETGRVFARRFVNDTESLVRVLEHKNYVQGRDLMYVEEEGAVHNEADWARRLPNALRFLLT